MTTPQPKVNTNIPYEVCVYRTRTGDVVGWVPLIGTPRWSGGINVAGDWAVQAALHSKSMSKSLLSQFIDPWNMSWAVCQGSVIHQAGPVRTEDFADSGDDYTQVNGTGLWGLYNEKRVLVNKDRASTSVITGIDADLAFGTGTTSDKGGPIPVANRNVSLPTIAKRILENEQGKPGGALPIILPDVGWEVAGTDVRTYQGPELAPTGQRLYELTQVQGGPEIQMIAEFTSGARSAVQHRIAIGKPRLGQLGYAHAWTYRKALTKFGYVTDGEVMTDRDWDKGTGFERNIKTGFAENLTDITTGFQTRPLLETVGQMHTSSDNQPELDAYALAAVTNGRTSDRVMIMEVSMNGDIGTGDQPPSPNFASVSCGDTAIAFVENHPRLADGQYYVRVIKKGSASGFKIGALTVNLLGVKLS